jgi:hypothetical protein
MANKYYYLVSSLPYLRFAQASPINTKAFLIECEKWLCKKDIGILLKAAISDFVFQPDDLPVIAAWKEFDYSVRTELALARKDRRDNRHDKPGQLAKIILGEKNPLLMEQVFERIRWNFLDSLEAGHFFDLNFLVIYFLKLQILERLAAFNKEKGEKMFEAMCEVNYE